MKKKFPLFLACFGVIFGLTGCGKTADPKTETKYDVKFFEDSELTVQYGETVKVVSGQQVSKPAVDPTKAEDENATYTFKEWVDYDTLNTYNFSNPVTKNLNLYAEFEEHVKESSLYVYLWQGDAEADLYITDAEAEAIKSKVLELTPGASFRAVKGESINQFCVDVNAFGKADVVIGGATLNPTDQTKYPERTAFVDAIPNSASESAGKLTKVATGWFASENRYVGICGGDQNNHYTEASKLYNALTSEGPYKATLSAQSVTLTMGESETITVQHKEGVAVTWGTDNAQVVTVDNGVLTPVAIGQAKVYAMVGPVRYQVSVSVIAERLPFTINVAMYARVYANIGTIKAEYEKVADDLCTVNWVTFESEKVAGFSEAVSNYATTNNVRIDLVVAHTQVTSGHENGLAYATTYNWSFSSRTLIKPTWSTKGDANYYAGVNALTKDQAESECLKIADILREDNPDYFELAETSASVLVGETLQINANGANVTYISKNADVATVSATGLITAIAAGTAVVEVSLGHKVVEFTVTVVEDTTPNNDLLVWINIRADQNWISETDRAFIETQLKALDSTKKIVLETRGETAVADVKAAQQAQGVKDRVDLIIGRNALANAGVFDNVTRTALDASWGFATGYVYEMSDMVEAHKELAQKAVNMLKMDKDQYIYGDNNFTLQEESALVLVGGTVQIEASADDVTYTSKNTEVATVNETGLVTGVAVGEAIIEVTKGNKTVNFTVTVAEDTTPNNDLLVWINLRTDKNWMSEADVQILETQLKALDSTKTINLVVKTESTVASVKTAQEEQGVKDRVDLIIGRDALANDGVYNNATRTALDASWGYSDGYIYEMSDIIDEHKTLAAAAVEMVSANREVHIYGDDLFTLTATSGVVKVNETITIEASKDATYTSNNTEIATVDASGVVTGVAEGSTTITCARGSYSVTFSVTVTPAEIQPFTVYVAMQKNAYGCVDTLKREYAKVAHEKATVVWVTNDEGKVAGFSEAVNTYATNNEVTIDLVVAHTQVTSGHANGLAYATTYNWSFSDRVLIDKTWSTALDTNYYAGTNALTTDPLKLGEVAKIVDILKVANPDYFELTSDSATIKVGETATISTKDGSTLSFESDNTEIATVDSTGKVTAKAIGSANITCTLGFKEVTFAVTVIAADAEPYSIYVALMSHESHFIDDLKAEYAKVADSNCTVVWITSEQSTYANFTDEIANYATTNHIIIDLIVGHANAFNTSKSDAFVMEYGYSFSSAETIDDSWSYNTDKEHKAGINALTTDALKLGECNKIVTILKTTKAA